MKKLLLAVSLVASPVAAQDIAFSPDATQICIASGQAPEDCIGRAADQCASANGYATAVLGFCYGQEADWWDARLNVAYQHLKNQAASMDATNGPNTPSQAKALRDMQRAWIPFRDRSCEFEASLWGGGTGAGPAYAACIMQMTAEQTLLLERALGN